MINFTKVMISLKFHPKEIEFPRSVDNIPVHSPCVYFTRQYQTVDDIMYLMTTYSFYYKNNHAIGCCHSLFPENSLLGFHPHDVEHVSIYSRNGTNMLVYFSAHGYGQGMWKEWNECEKDKDNRLVVYVARNSHACYPESRTYIRAFGLANDECSSEGKTVIPSIFYPSFDWCSSNGVKLYASPRPKHPTTSFTDKQRFFLPFSK
jgi:hypothetical protein